MWTVFYFLWRSQWEQHFKWLEYTKSFSLLHSQTSVQLINDWLPDLLISWLLEYILKKSLFIIMAGVYSHFFQLKLWLQRDMNCTFSLDGLAGLQMTTCFRYNGYWLIWTLNRHAICWLATNGYIAILAIPSLIHPFFASLITNWCHMKVTWHSSALEALWASLSPYKGWPVLGSQAL